MLKKTYLDENGFSKTSHEWTHLVTKKNINIIISQLFKQKNKINIIILIDWKYRILFDGFAKWIMPHLFHLSLEDSVEKVGKMFSNQGYHSRNKESCSKLNASFPVVTATNVCQVQPEFQIRENKSSTTAFDFLNKTPPKTSLYYYDIIKRNEKKIEIASRTQEAKRESKRIKRQEKRRNYAAPKLSNLIEDNTGNNHSIVEHELKIGKKIVISKDYKEKIIEKRIRNYWKCHGLEVR